MSPAYSLPVRFSETLPSLLPHHSLLSLSCCFQRVGVHLSPRSSSGGSRCSPGTALGGRHSPLAWSRGGTLPNHGRSTISHPHPPTPSSHVSCSFGCPYVLWAFKLACPSLGAEAHCARLGSTTRPSGGSWTSTSGISWPLSTWNAAGVRRRSRGGHGTLPSVQLTDSFQQY